LMHDGVAWGGKSLRLNACFNFTNFKCQNHKYSHISPFGIWLSRIRKKCQCTLLFHNGCNLQCNNYHFNGGLCLLLVYTFFHFCC
jgi:hypothetical protein